jgi:hypothetical protein
MQQVKDRVSEREVVSASTVSKLQCQISNYDERAKQNFGFHLANNISICRKRLDRRSTCNIPAIGHIYQVLNFIVTYIQLHNDARLHSAAEAPPKFVGEEADAILAQIYGGIRHQLTSDKRPRFQ